MVEGRAKLIALPSVHVWFAVCVLRTGALAGVETPNVSLADKPLVSVAVTLIANPATVVGLEALFGVATVPENVPVAALNVSHDGKADVVPFEFT